MRVTHYTLLVVGVLAVSSFAGCGKGGDAGTVTAASTSPTTPDDPVARVVYDFLDAVRQGNTDEASKRLTPLALRRTSELDMNFSPPGSATARFEVGDVELVSQSQAVVHSIWKDLDADGQPTEETIVWGLRMDSGMWRISGMMAQSEPDAEPTVIDFENPEAMAQERAQPAQVGPPAGNPNAPLPSDKVAKDPFQATTQR